MTTPSNGKTMLWQASDDRIQQANMTRFMRFVNERHLLAIEDYAQLHAFSIERSEDFWSAVWEFCGIRASGELQPVVDDPYKMPNARWFANVRINFAQNLLRFKDDRIGRA
jgi:acetoacetyl-CoA synthetase